ncbi:hypothetical protein QE152_g33346 [Popillia japonica]|uniref:Uncharacterized protein n=1 Tax=Popillia japonica TaxID=7064 RepID=A0AAW1IXF6_POPJA
MFNGKSYYYIRTRENDVLIVDVPTIVGYNVHFHGTMVKKCQTPSQTVENVINVGISPRNFDPKILDMSSTNVGQKHLDISPRNVGQKTLGIVLRNVDQKTLDKMKKC